MKYTIASRARRFPNTGNSIDEGFWAYFIKKIRKTYKKIFIAFAFLSGAVSATAWEGSPVPASPKTALSYPQQNWRDKRYEVFQWDDFPSILIFDTVNYEIQDRIFKRLAFFVEKAGFRGKLARNEEIAEAHGWNAHDYRAEDLAAFFEKARQTQFTLNWEEGELADILVRSGIISQNEAGAFQAGTGALVSISRESPDYLRHRFMVHEGFHGIFFIDEEFRNFSRRRYENFPLPIKRFILSFFDYQHYDVKDQYLVVNEFMAHILQQSVSQAGEYFGKTLASRIDASSWRRTVLPPKDADTDSWPDIAKAFQAEAAAFSDYVNRRWGFTAGRVWK
ncbi:MAG: hypothetical protein LBG87_04760 [Spirochaetaceae bacterium]|jgi:hypothetical protein|nr:hypothetical protein [Spirochaetaceae bacterium]